jgi:O-antigen ligase
MIILAIIRHAGFQFSFVGINKSLFPFFRNHVNYSALLVCLFPTGYIFLKASGSKTKLRLIICFLLLVAFAGLILAYSRGAWLALPIGILAYWFIQKGIIRVAITFTAIAIISSVIFLFQNQRFLAFQLNHDQTYFHEKLHEHLTATVTLEDVSNGERIYRWIAGAYMVVNKPITGFGTNSFYPAYKSYTLPAYKTWVSNNPDHSTVHNYFLLVTIEQGLPGLCIFFVLIVYMFTCCQKVYIHAANPLYKQLAICAGTTLAMILFLNFFSDLLETDKIGGLFWLIVSVIIVMEKEKINIQDSVV